MIAVQTLKPLHRSTLSIRFIAILCIVAAIVLRDPKNLVMEENCREYLCGTCDQPVTWEQRGVLCETCDQWYHSSCQNISSKTYEVLSDSDLNVSWHCLICNGPNHSSTVHDLFSNEISYCSSSIGAIPDFSTLSPDPTRHNLKPVHSSTPVRKQQP